MSMNVNDKAAFNADIVRRFNPSLHGCRGLFALMVVLFHVANSGLPTVHFLAQSWPLFLSRSLAFGVELFFGISGIVIFGALSRAKGPYVFALERITRIYPVLWVTVITLVILGGLSGFEGRSFPSIPVLIENLLALPPLFPGPVIHPAAWSLSYELGFYFFCAGVWILRRRIGWWAALIMAPLALFIVGTHVRMILMPVGMGVAMFLANKPSLARFARFPGVCLFVFIISWGLMAQSSGRSLDSEGLIDLRSGWTPLLAIIALFAASLGYAGVLGGRGLFCAVMRWRPVQFLGTISYSLYLWHPIVMSVAKHGMYVLRMPSHLGNLSQLGFLLVSLPPSLFIGWLSQITLEKRVTVWLRSRIEGRLAPGAVITAPSTSTHAL